MSFDVVLVGTVPFCSLERAFASSQSAAAVAVLVVDRASLLPSLLRL